MFWDTLRSDIQHAVRLAGEVAADHRPDRRRARARHRRQQRHLRGRRQRARQAAALCRRRSAGERLERCDQAGPPAEHAVAGKLQRFSEDEQDPRRPRGVLLVRHAVQSDRRRRQQRDRRRGLGDAAAVRFARPQADHGPPHVGRRRAARDAHQLRLLAAAVWRRPGNHRAHDAGPRRRAHHRRRDAAGLHVPLRLDARTVRLYACDDHRHVGADSIRRTTGNHQSHADAPGTARTRHALARRDRPHEAGRHGRRSAGRHGGGGAADGTVLSGDQSRVGRNGGARARTDGRHDPRAAPRVAGRRRLRAHHCRRERREPRARAEHRAPEGARHARGARRRTPPHDPAGAHRRAAARGRGRRRRSAAGTLGRLRAGAAGAGGSAATAGHHTRRAHAVDHRGRLGAHRDLRRAAPGHRGDADGAALGAAGEQPRQRGRRIPPACARRTRRRGSGDGGHVDRSAQRCCCGASCRSRR